MSESAIPKTITIDFSRLSESMQNFHINTAGNNGIPLEEQLLDFIRTHTEQEQEEGRKRFRDETKKTQNLWRELGASVEIPGVIRHFDLEDDSQE